MGRCPQPDRTRARGGLRLNAVIGSDLCALNDVSLRPCRAARLAQRAGSGFPLHDKSDLFKEP